jgi:hypothetical protein
MLKIFKRDLFLCAAITAFVILCALAWGSPFVGTTSHAGAVLAQNRYTHPMVFNGAIQRDGNQVLLRDSSGTILHFDNPQSAEAFVGKTVTINGHLEVFSKTIHIEHIKPAA